MRRPRRLRSLLASTAAVAVLSGLAGCGTSSATDTTASASTSAESVAAVLEGNVEVETGDTAYDEADAVDVDLDAEDGTVTLTEAGTYRLSGTLDGQVVVDSAGDGVVRLVLDGVDITSDTSAAINVVDAESVVVVLADGSENSLTDATTYADTGEDAPTGALYSTADLTIGGTGSLTVTGNSNNGIVGKDGLVITGGTIDVTSVDDGIIGKDYLVVTGGEVTVDATDDGMKSDNTEDDGAGFVLLQGGTVTVHSEDDGIKGRQVLVSDGTITVAESVEALEGSLIVIDGGQIELHSADDAVNVASSDDSTAADGAPGGGMEADSSLHLVINGGTLEVWASGDGLDSNGDATITGGDITVYGPTTDGNGALDVNGAFTISGGTLLAAGSAGMMVAPDSDSGQAWLATALTATAPAGSTLVITDADGDEVASYELEKDAASVVFSSADLESGATYTLTVDGDTDQQTTVTAGEAPAGGGMGPR